MPSSLDVVDPVAPLPDVHYPYDFDEDQSPSPTHSPYPPKPRTEEKETPRESPRLSPSPFPTRSPPSPSSSSPTPPPAADSPSHPRRMTASVVLSSSALQSLSALKSRRRTRAASAVNPRQRQLMAQAGEDGVRGLSKAFGEDENDGQHQRQMHRRKQSAASELSDDDSGDDDVNDEDVDGDRDDRAHRYGRASPLSRDDEADERLPPLHSPPLPPLLHTSSSFSSSSRRTSHTQHHHHGSVPYALTPSPTPSVPLLPTAPRPRTRAASAFPSLNSHASSPSSSTPSHSSSSSSSSEPVFLLSDALTPLDHPSSTLSSLSRLLSSPDWSARFHALTSFRRLVVHHPSLLTSAVMRPLVRDVKTEVDSLRSLLAKNALVAFADLFSLPSSFALFDTDLPLLLPPLLKRSGEPSSSFLATEADHALTALFLHAPPSRTLQALLSAQADANKLIRAQSLAYLARLTVVHAAALMGCGELPRLLQALALACGEASAAVRGWGRRGVGSMEEVMGWDDVERGMKRVVSASAMQVVRKAIDLERRERRQATDSGERSVSFSPTVAPVVPPALSISGVGAFEYPKRIDTSFSLDSSVASSLSLSPSPSTPSYSSASPSPTKPSILKRRSTLSTTSSTSSSASSSSRSSRLSPGVPGSAVPAEVLSSIVADMGSTEWRVRLSSVDRLCGFAGQFPSFTSTSSGGLMDPLFSLISDPHGKVQLHCLSTLSGFLPVLLPSLPLLPLLQRIAPLLAASSTTVRSLASDLLDRLPEWLGDGCAGLVQGYAQVAQYGGVKVRGLMVEKMIEVLGRGGGRGKGRGGGALGTGAGVKAAVPVCFLWLDEGRAELCRLLQRLTLLVYGVMGSEMFDAAVMQAYKISPTQMTRMKQKLNLSP